VRFVASDAIFFLDSHRKLCNNSFMPDRSSKDNHPLVKAVIDELAKPEPKKNPAAVALGRMGGLKGGKARAAKLSPSKRKAIAKRAAKTRWAKTSEKPHPK
jgi:hypothetical protein